MVRGSVADDVAPLPFPLWLLFVVRFVLLLPVPDEDEEAEDECEDEVRPPPPLPLPPAPSANWCAPEPLRTVLAERVLCRTIVSPPSCDLLVASFDVLVRSLAAPWRRTADEELEPPPPLLPEDMDRSGGCESRTQRTS